MAMIARGQVGILPAGALGGGFFSDLTGKLTRLEGDVVFLEREGSASAMALREAGVMLVRDAAGALHRLLVERFVLGDPSRLAAEGKALPEVLLIAVNTDQVTRVVSMMVGIAEQRRAALCDTDEAIGIPAFVFCANGIYHGMLRGLLDERLEESVNKGLLTARDRACVNAALLRGVTYQHGSREGEGANCIYIPGGSAGTAICGSDAAVVARVVEVLRAKGGAFGAPAHGNPLRAEFDKAALNLVVNSWGVILSVDAAGDVHPLTIGRIFEEHAGVVERTARVLASIGVALRVYPPSTGAAEIVAQLRAGLPKFAGHTSSSVAFVSRESAAGRLQPGLPPADEAFLCPLIRYARYADLEEEARHFEELLDELQAAVARAAERCQRG